MKQLINKVIGNTEDISVEQRVFIYLCGLGSIPPLIMTILNIVNKLYFQMIITLSIMIVCLVLYYFARFKKQYFFLFGILFIAFMDYLAYFDAFGIMGPVSYFIIIIFIFGLLSTPLKGHFKLFIFFLTGSSIIFLVEYIFPQMVHNPFKSQNALHVHLFAGLIFCLFITFVCIYFLRKGYENEKVKNREQRELIEKMANDKSMFFINLSHEIKTPITLVENYLESYIRRKGEDDELVIMQQNIQKMRRDILEYLNIENIERGKFSFEKLEVISLSGFLDEKISIFTYYAKNKNITLNYFMQPDVRVKVNSKGIEQILNNLLENAVKYTPERGVINVTLENNKEEAKIIVQNSGHVIPSDQLPHLFEPFYQLSKEKQNVQGIGMGLYTVKKILEYIGGQIQVNSSAESGVVFIISLPLCADEITESPVSNSVIPNLVLLNPKAEDSPYSTQKQCLLVVEDHNDLLCYLVGELHEHYNVFVADNGLTALEKLETMPAPELIISDIMMDKIDGYGLLERTLADERFSHIPFIFLTAKNSSEEKIAGLDSGALDFIIKPFSIEELKIKINTIIGQKTRISEAAIREMKRQFADTQLLEIRQKNGEIFISNSLKYNLTAREKEIVTYIRQGLRYEEIGEKLHISEHTVTRHVQNIYRKTGSSTKIGLIDKMFA